MLVVLALARGPGFVSGDTFSHNRRCVGPFWMVGLNANHFAAFIAHISVSAIGLLALTKTRSVAGSTGLPSWHRSIRCSFPTRVARMWPCCLPCWWWRCCATAPSCPLLIIFMIFWDSILPSSVVDRIQMTESPDGQIEESAALRLVVGSGQTHFSENPFFGIGYQGFYYASAGLPLHNVHNYYLQTAAEQGIFGCILLATFFIRGLWSGWRLYRDGCSNFLRGTGLGFIACLSAMMITNIFGDRFSQIEVGSYFWVFGIVDRARVLKAEPAPESAEPQKTAPIAKSKWT